MHLSHKYYPTETGQMSVKTISITDTINFTFIYNKATEICPMDCRYEDEISFLLHTIISAPVPSSPCQCVHTASASYHMAITTNFK